MSSAQSLKKCIVLDLDNTLWGGVVGEDGKDGLALSTTPPGAYFIAFQQALLDMAQRGIILAVNSANNYEETMDVIRTHPNMILKEQHFAAFRINWKDKVENMQELAHELNIGLDSMVFLDDNPINRAAMRQMLPMVETPELPADLAAYAQFLLSLPFFPDTATTDEDKMRGNLYVTERLRRESEKAFEDKEAFLESLRIEVRVFVNDQSALARLSQLTEKTNQFNTDKKPMTESELAAAMTSDTHAVFHARVIDRFGDQGITAFALVEKGTPSWHIASLLLSCRVIGRGVEEAFLHAVAQRALAEGAESLTIALRPTDKNKPAQDFVAKMFPTPVLSVRSVECPAWVTLA